jgi:GNAT superfamily N-acetyltransferase
MAAIAVRIAAPEDVAALAVLRAEGQATSPEFADRMAAWLAAEGERRTTWLATLDSSPAGMASLLEYRRMPRPDAASSCWGYVSNMYVSASLRGRGIGTALLQTVVATADDRGYVRLVLSPSERSVPLYRRAGFVDAGPRAGADRLLVRPA